MAPWTVLIWKPGAATTRPAPTIDTFSVAGGSSANTITIKVRFADFKTITRSKTLDLPTTGTQEIFEVVKALYLALNLDRALIRLVGVGLDSLVENEDLQQMVLGQRDSGWRQVDRAVDLVKEKFGRSSLRPARLVSEDDEDNSG